MTRLSLAARNYLIQDSAITALLGSSPTWPEGWIFSDNIYVRLEKSSKVAVVITETTPRAGSGNYTTSRQPLLDVDIWADPTRNPDGSVQTWDAKDKIENVHELIKKKMHVMKNEGPNGYLLQWGTAAEIASKTGVTILNSELIGGPIFRPIADGDGAFMGSYTYEIGVY